MHPIVIRVNGAERALVVDPSVSLLHVLRDELRLTGTKEGCGTGYCGACTVLVDGAPVNSCLFFAVDADRKDVTTIEGLSRGALHAVQQAFVERSALQCGFCTPGMVLSAAALLAERPHPNEEDVRAGLAGNLCRCTGYQSIVRAVLEASERIAEGDQAPLAERDAPIRARA